MERNVKAVRNDLVRRRAVGLPMDFAIKIVASRVIMPARNADNEILLFGVDDLHVSDRGVADKTTFLLVEVEAQAVLCLFHCLDWAADWCRRSYKVISWGIRDCMRHELSKILELQRKNLERHTGKRNP